MNADCRVRSLVLDAPAKVNLYLRIVGKRPDGYHDIETLFHKLKLADNISISLEGKEIGLRCHGIDLPDDDSNLACLAAKKFFSKTNIPPGVKMVLEKRIPVAAGLGGGSSDAAAVLLGLNRLHGFPLDHENLVRTAARLGADVPFFMEDWPAAWATGRGDVLAERPSLGNLWVLLVNPGFAVSTRWVYQNFTLTTPDNPYILRPKQSEHNPYPYPSSPDSLLLYNDLESVTVKRFPELETIKKELLAGGAAGALMSGSGPTVFGIFTQQRLAAQMSNVLFSRYGKGVILTGLQGQ